MSFFSGTLDHHKGITIDSKINICNNTAEFSLRLEASLEKWNEDQLRGVWFNVDISQIEWMPILSQKGFKIHHAKNDMVSCYLWLPKTESCKIPPYAHNLVGAGALVINDKNQVLVVKERFRTASMWKLPGGYVNPGEEISEAAQREVLEETGIKTEFISLLSFRHLPKAVFGCSDLYFVVQLKPVSSHITKQDEEIDDCKWMDIGDFLSSSEVLELVKNYVREMIDNIKNGIYMVRKSSKHPFSKNPQFIYSINYVKPK